MTPHQIRHFQELAEAFCRSEVPEKALKVLVWESFKSYADSLRPFVALQDELQQHMQGAATTPITDQQVDEVLTLMKKVGIKCDPEYVAKLKAGG